MPPLSDSSKLGLANRFTVKIDFASYDLGSWAQADGLDVKWDIAEYRAGDGGNVRWYFPGNTQYSTLRLTRAACEDSKTVKKWLSETSFTWKPYSGKVVLHDSAGAPVMDWTLQHVMPVKWSITGFDAGASKVATETLELAHHGFLDDAKTL
jgi:phage tail-like protein